MTPIEDRIKALGYTLPEPPAAAGNYLPYRICNNLLFLAGTLPVGPDGLITGKVGLDLSEEEAYAAARTAVLAALANAKFALNSLGKVRQILVVNGFVNAVAGYTESPKVVDGASDFLVEAFGDIGRHTRTAVAVTGLPGNAPIELQITLEFM